VPNVGKLILAGAAAPDPESRSLMSTPELLGSVQYVGPVDRRALADLYRGASAFVLSSNEEGQGIVLVEAMATGLPIIATSCVGPTEVVSNGVEGLLTPVGSVDAFADAIARVWANPMRRRQMSQASRQRAVREFSLERTGARLADVYRASGVTTGRQRRPIRPALREA
jgi:glycosyltransferase involved in cell wall biosynthesis